MALFYWQRLNYIRSYLKKGVDAGYVYKRWEYEIMIIQKGL
jgi:hypothetical protein